MKNHFYLFLIRIVLLDSSSGYEQLYPNLPVGEFNVLFKSIIQCNASEKSNVGFNLRLNKKSASITEFLGNITLKEPLDDSFAFNLNMAVKDLIGGWKDNSHILKMTRGCTAMKTLLNKLWLPFVNAFGMNSNCPILPGTYVSKGFDLSKMSSGITGSKIFFYGVYKSHIFFTDKYNNMHGCLIVVIEIKRPWEKELIT